MGLAIPHDNPGGDRWVVTYDRFTGKYVISYEKGYAGLFEIEYLDDEEYARALKSKSFIPIQVDKVWTGIPFDLPRTKVYQMVAKEGATFTMPGPVLNLEPNKEKNLQNFKNRLDTNFLLPPTVKGVIWEIEPTKRGVKSSGGFFYGSTPEEPSEWTLTAVRKDAGIPSAQAARPPLPPSKGGARTRRQHLKISTTRRKTR
jgi:hypothetical protein